QNRNLVTAGLEAVRLVLAPIVCLDRLPRVGGDIDDRHGGVWHRSPTRVCHHAANGAEVGALSKQDRGREQRERQSDKSSPLESRHKKNPLPFRSSPLQA